MPCCGRPLEDELNDCPRQPQYVVVGTQMKPRSNEPVLLVLTCCDAHLAAVRAYQSQWEDGFSAPIDALPLILEDLGEEAWIATSAAV